MKTSSDFVAVDLGASNGRVMVGNWDGQRFTLEELHRFPNRAIAVGNNLCWDALDIWAHVQFGLNEYRLRFQGSPAGIGVDAWGVDFALLDAAGEMLGNPAHYRDPRTEGMPERVFAKVPEEAIFRATGVQTMPINTLFQIYSMIESRDSRLTSAATLVSIPDLFLYFLCGVKGVEFTEATTMQMYAPEDGNWAWNVLREIGVPHRFLPEIIRPGTVAGPLRAGLQRSCGFLSEVPVIVVAGHDTASAVAAIPHLDDGSAFISSGTWSLMGVEIPQPVISEAALRMHFTNEGSASGAYLLLKNITGLWLIQECMHHWKTEGRAYSWNEIVEAASGAEPLRAIGDPNDKRLQVQADMPQAICSYCQATGQPAPETTGQFARFVFESLCLKYRSVLAALEQLTGREIHTLRTVGGGAQNALLCQMTADACNRPVVSGPVEAATLGNVMLQAVAIGSLADQQAGRMAIAGSVVCDRFNPGPGAEWDRAFMRFRDLEVD